MFSGADGGVIHKQRYRPGIDRSMEANLEIISMELIKPSSPTPADRKILRNSSLDQFAPFFYVPLVFFYQNSQSGSKILQLSERTQLLKESLSESLTKFFPLAGKINEDGSIDSDDSGALFVEAKVHVPLLHAFQGSCPLEKLDQYLPFEPYSINSNGKLLETYPRNDILLGVKISWFQCGGSALGVCISHKVADFMSLVTFMNSWAAGASGITSANALVMEPNFCLGRQVFPPLDLLPKFSRPVKKGKIIRKRLLFDKKKLAELKQLATLPDQAAKFPTAVEAVTSFLWKHFIKAGRAMNQAARIKFIATHAVNLRSKISRLTTHAADNQFPFGNFSFITFASFISDAEDQEEKDYRDLVGMTSMAIKKVDEDHVMNRIAYPFSNGLWVIEKHGEEDEAEIISDWSFSSWCRTPVYEVDFGWGKPAAVCPGGTRTQNGVILTSTRSGDGIEAWISIFEDEIDMLPDELLSLGSTDILAMNS